MSNDIPVVFIESSMVGGHAKNPEWFKQARFQAQEFNATVYYIGNEPEANVPLADFMAEDSRQLIDYYEHLSTNHYAFELFCLHRWFVLYGFMQSMNLDAVLHLDSDVLLFCNAQQEWDTYSTGTDFTLSMGSSAATAFITKGALLKFCQFIADTYSEANDESAERLSDARRIFAEMRDQNLPGGISDMWFWNQFVQTGRYNWVEMTKIVKGATWDHNINVSDGYEMLNGMKRIQFLHSDIPFGFLERENKIVQFKALHFQGSAKKELPNYVIGKNTLIAI